MGSLPDGIYADAINRAAMMLVAMSARPDLESSLVDEITAAVIVRGGQIDGLWLTAFDLRAVFEEIAERTTAILSAALRERLPGIADEIDETFGKQLRRLLGSMTPLFPTL
jgi:hypothetical protein